tara:strand:+ start:666 stop:1244 length:579 start_codon:yes stop_codon:yes gene_type:complete
MKQSQGVYGIGSVGLSTMFFLNETSILPPTSLLFVRSNFEKKLEGKAIESLSSRKKLDAFKILSNSGLVKIIECTVETINEAGKTLLKIFENQKMYNIVGLGGESGDFFVKLLEVQVKKEQEITSFCILPFKFEGTKRINYAQYQLETIMKMQGKTIVLKNDDLLKKENKNLSFEEAFANYHKIIRDGIYDR